MERSGIISISISLQSLQMPLRSIRIICSLLPIRLWILIPRVNTANSRLPISALFHLCGKQEWQHCHHQLVKPPLHAADQVASIGVPSPLWLVMGWNSFSELWSRPVCCSVLMHFCLLSFDFFLWGDKILPKIGLFHGSHMHRKGNVQTRCGQSCLLDSHKREAAAMCNPSAHLSTSRDTTTGV